MFPASVLVYALVQLYTAVLHVLVYQIISCVSLSDFLLFVNYVMSSLGIQQSAKVRSV
jgi:hypothetical protein